MHVSRQLCRPRIDGGLKRIAVRAAVPEQFNHFDFARLSNRNGIRQLNVGLAGFKRDIGRLSSHAKQGGADENGAENQITHALLLDK